MKKKINLLLCAGLMMTSAATPQLAQASYHSDTDTGVGVLDYIENERREARENFLTDEQKLLLKDAYEMKRNLREPLDPSKNIPLAVEGDDLLYDQNTGAFSATGSVKITSLDQKRFFSNQVIGNLKATEVNIDGKAHMLQLTPDQARIVLDGYRIQYNYGKKLGSMEDISGKIDHQYIKAKRIELYPDRMVLFQASATKCPGIRPDYHIGAEKIEVYPKVKIVYHNAKMWLGDVPVLSVKKQTVSLNEKDSIKWPRVGYNPDDGFWLRQEVSVPLADRFDIYTDILYTTKHNFHNQGGLRWRSKYGTFALVSGFFESNDNKWIKKAPSFTYNFSKHFNALPASWKVAYERGHWSQEGIHSMHTYYMGGIELDPIISGKWRFLLDADYSITKESYDHNKDHHGISYTASAVNSINDRWALYAGYHYTYLTSKTSVFDFDLDDYRHKFMTGFSYRFSDEDRLVVGTAFDTSSWSLRDVDYYWFHDIHCAQLITRIRGKRRQMHFTLEFTPW